WDGRILDVGCGHQPYRSLFRGRCAGYIGCDMYTVIGGAVTCHADKLAFNEATFEAVVCFQVLEHVQEPWLVIEECARVLKPTGVLLLTAPFIFPYHSSPDDFYRYTR